MLPNSYLMLFIKVTSHKHYAFEIYRFILQETRQFGYVVNPSGLQGVFFRSITVAGETTRKSFPWLRDEANVKVNVNLRKLE